MTPWLSLITYILVSMFSVSIIHYFIIPPISFFLPSTLLLSLLLYPEQVSAHILAGLIACDKRLWDRITLPGLLAVRQNLISMRDRQLRVGLNQMNTKYQQ